MAPHGLHKGAVGEDVGDAPVQPGGDRIRSMGVRVESLARIKSMSEETGVEFVD